MQRAQDLHTYISAFEKKLEAVAVDDISTALYCKKYLSHLLAHKRYYLFIYADVLEKLLAHSTKNKASIKVIDFGAGNGLLGLFAKFCGFNKVIIYDIDPKFVAAAEMLAGQLNITPGAYISGEIDSLQSYCLTEIPDAIIGTDVIEHVYKLEELLSVMRQINPLMVSVFTTASNPSNIFKVKTLQKIQLKDELEGGEPGDHVLFGESALKPFLKIREDIIRKKNNALPDAAVMILAKGTRGMNEADIIKAVDDYGLTKNIPVPADEYNTCNPLNGSWTERILPLDTYILRYKYAGFTCTFYAGFYNEYEGGIAAFVKKLLNVLVSISGNKISPYIVIVGGKI